MPLTTDTILNKVVQDLEKAIFQARDRESLPLSDSGKARAEGFTWGLKRALEIVKEIKKTP